MNFFTNGKIPVDRIVRAVNSLLPPDIVVTKADEADHEFSARHSAKAKTYIYRVQQGETANVFTNRYAWYVRRQLDVALMQAALQKIVGMHDFSAFRASGGAPMSPVRTMYEATVIAKADGILEFKIYGSGFISHGS